MSVFCFKSDTTLGGLLDGYRIGGGPQKDQAMIRSLKLSAHTHLLGRGEGLEIELTTIDYVFVTTKFKELGEHICVLGQWYTPTPQGNVFSSHCNSESHLMF